MSDLIHISARNRFSATAAVLALVAVLTVGCADHDRTKKDSKAASNNAADAATNNPVDDVGVADTADLGATDGSDLGANDGGNATNPTCPTVAPAQLDFGHLYVGDDATLPFTVDNCSEDTLTVVDIATPYEFDFFGNGIIGTVLAAGASKTFEVFYDAASPGEHSGAVELIMDTGVNVSVPVAGWGVAPSCALVTAAARDSDSDPWTSAVLVVQNSVVQLSGAQTTSRSDIRGYEWSVTTRPGGSRNQVLRADQPEALFLPDAPGSYEIELRVDTTDSTDECPRGRLQIEAVPSTVEDLSIEVTWDTDQDDVDLHYKTRAGSWDEPGEDCYPWSPIADWGPQGAALVVAEDTAGFGPETISHYNAESGVFDIGVEFRQPRPDNAPLVPSIKVSRGSTVLYEADGPALMPFEFWSVGSIDAGTDLITVDGTSP